MALFYVSHSAGQEVRGYRIDDETGRVGEAVAIAALPGKGGPLATDPTGRQLHAAVRSEPWRFLSYAIERHSGRLIELGETPSALNNCYISVDRTGRHMLQASYTGDRIAVNPIGRWGHVQEPPTQVIATPPKAHWIRTDPSNRFALVSSLGGDCILQYRFDDRTGRLRPNRDPAVRLRGGCGPRQLCFHPGGRFVYSLQELDATLYSYRFDPESGTLTELDRIPALLTEPAERVFAAEITISPDGRHLYATERGTSTVNSFAIDRATGLLTPIECVRTVERPRGCVVHPYGRWLLVSGELSDRLVVYAIAPDGTLSAHHETRTGVGPHWIELIGPD